MAHVAKWKFGEVEQITNILTEKKIVGIAEIGGIPAPQLQKMRENIRGKAQIRCAKNSLIFIISPLRVKFFFLTKLLGFSPYVSQENILYDATASGNKASFRGSKGL